MSGDGKLKIRKEMGNFVRGVTTIPLPPTTNNAIIDFEVIVKYMYRMSRHGP
jgi:dynein heavy chain 1